MARITVEDCLKKENNRFSLVLLASLRAKQILTGSPILTDSEGNKAIVASLREIADSKVRFMTTEEVTLQMEEDRRRALEEEEMNNNASALSVGPSIISPISPMVPNGNGFSDGAVSDDSEE